MTIRSNKHPALLSNDGAIIERDREIISPDNTLTLYTIEMRGARLNGVAKSLFQCLRNDQVLLLSNYL